VCVGWVLVDALLVSSFFGFDLKKLRGLVPLGSLLFDDDVDDVSDELVLFAAVSSADKLQVVISSKFSVIY
jgi:hypothetical protein